MSPTKASATTATTPLESCLTVGPAALVEEALAAEPVAVAEPEAFPLEVDLGAAADPEDPEAVELPVAAGLPEVVVAEPDEGAPDAVVRGKTRVPEDPPI
jgi:hypothetical protein